MNSIEATVQGTLQPDGTLVLDTNPELPPGRVTVLRQEPKAAPREDDWFQFLLAARKRMEESGYYFMNDEEVQAHIAWLREGNAVAKQRCIEAHII